MKHKLFDSELKVMEVLWRGGEMPARDIARVLSESIGWNKNTTYTVLKKCIEKGAAIREDPGFRCRACVTREEVQRAQAHELMEKMFGGSPSSLVASLLGGCEKLPNEENERLHRLIDTLR